MLGVQLYTLRNCLNNDDNVRMTAKKLKEMGCLSVQLFHGEKELEKMSEIFSSEGIEIIGTLTSIDKLENDPNLFETCKKYGLKDIGISSNVITDEDVDALVSRVNAMADKAKNNGITFSYHNHACEFTRLSSGKTVMDRFLAEFNSNVTFMPDTYWLQVGGVNVIEWIEKNGSRISILHLKDLTVLDRTPTFAEIGQGNLNFPSIIKTAMSVGVNNFIIEQDFCRRDPFESVKISIEYLRGVL